ncbi:hypothetical protein J6590_066266 [Homalodisca vitripennis]|nr:hypothetical protein J6590_066266 [Homalodisca vitripennis]
MKRVSSVKSKNNKLRMREKSITAAEAPRLERATGAGQACVCACETQAGCLNPFCPNIKNADLLPSTLEKAASKQRGEDGFFHGHQVLKIF